MNKLWWTLLVRGIAAILFGITAIAWPGLTLIVLIYMFAFFTIVDGALIIASSFMDSNRDENWWLMLLLGISLAGFGGITLFRPEVTALLLLLLIAARFLVSGILEIVIAIRLRKEIEGEFYLILSGLISFGLGILLLSYPVSGALAMVFVIGLVAISSGVLLCLVSLKLRKMVNEVSSMDAGSSDEDI